MTSAQARSLKTSTGNILNLVILTSLFSSQVQTVVQTNESRFNIYFHSVDYRVHYFFRLYNCNGLTWSGYGNLLETIQGLVSTFFLIIFYTQINFYYLYSSLLMVFSHHPLILLVLLSQNWIILRPTKWNQVTFFNAFVYCIIIINTYYIKIWWSSAASYNRQGNSWILRFCNCELWFVSGGSR